MNSYLLHLFVISLLFINHVLAYGYVGHEITAVIAQRFLTPEARKNVQLLLPKEAKGDLSFIASWADRVKYTPEYNFTSRMHFFTPRNDKPPNQCFAMYIPGRIDLLNAIHNYTNRLDPNNDLAFWPRAEALRFLVHFIGDLHQPLHVTARLRGGNAIFEGHKTNLHFIWDSRLINKHIRELGYNQTFSDDHQNITNGGRFYDPYVRHILRLMKSVWKQEVSEWIVCNNVGYTFEKETQELFNSNKFGNKNKQILLGLNSQEAQKEYSSLGKQYPSVSCPEFWVIPINKLNCQIVWNGYKPDIELDEGEYYERIKRTRIVEKLLAVGGIRIAAVLNSLLG
ncbi:20191_t:CDS:2 [Funneliformis geosporum]|uniref:14272_t:CDS:1 n=1 Tax=Funneliformis geosporum TaxID=1117311 RepID=A0A9W4WIX4_9GLOM|nr:20191_t:CDS:2 [Funneliformis geosporum]CAI2165205.1 14272_t:CDS:2 [Funneliformis geosporum]